MLNAVNEELLDYTSFVSFVKENIKERMGHGYKVKVYKVMKNNSLELDSLVVLKEDRSFAPNIYLNAYYESYLEGTCIREIMDRLCMIYSHCAVPAVQDNFEYSFELMKPYIFFRIISLDRNKKMLAQIPYMEFLDLAITFHCLVRSEEDNIATIQITNEHIRLWGVTSQDIKDLAFENTRRLFPPVIKSIGEMINGIISGDIGEKEGIIIENDCNDEFPMYVLTNVKGINGASCLLYKDVIKELAQLLKSDLYILPSSIHELILVPMVSTKDKESFSRMVMEINSSQLPVEEILADHVYIYSLSRDTISL
ncbi:MAG: hypothetical protein GX319_09330 [Clostridiales bacterium]|jgi:hypothetical protein|nr:DUF5688 family protein [Bacillota bacterium]NLK04589.1 hypothetical protein [Clostridiales bacterium]